MRYLTLSGLSGGCVPLVCWPFCAAAGAVGAVGYARVKAALSS